MSPRAPRRNSYQRLVEESPNTVNKVATCWNAIIAAGRVPTIAERVEMADLLGMNDAHFYDFRRHCEDIFTPIPENLKRKTGQTTTALNSPQKPGPGGRQKPSLPTFGTVPALTRE